MECQPHGIRPEPVPLRGMVPAGGRRAGRAVHQSQLPPRPGLPENRVIIINKMMIFTWVFIIILLFQV